MYKQNISIIIPAAGASKRMGSAAVHKPYIRLKNKPILAYSLKTFLRLPGVREIIIAIHPQDQARIKHLISKCESVFSPSPHPLPLRERERVRGIIKVVQGGATRQASVYNALQEVSAESQWVLIHDAARPFIRLQEIKRLVKAVKKHGAGLLAVPVSDTIKRINVRGCRVKETLMPRDELWLAQTPQGFKKEIIIQAYRNAVQKVIKATDDASLVEAMGYPVKIVKGNYENIKITTKRDLRH